ncbi:Hint domain-containing protein [Ruegeria sp.]|uniref:Hint domain-containing protein n=1 Tax=Ruegeria sp. TaxID=1879320 RepID=UPI002309149C|nr:Hint domain-containing protein [Ruegeria sp.]MDA7966560.1 Hint domain-containing protein [Ruegeria sp.]
MTKYTLDASTSGSFSLNVGGNSSDDTVVVNIGEDFSGTISVLSRFGDGELETVDINYPSGWSVTQTSSVPLGWENPQATYSTFSITDAAGVPRGTMVVVANRFGVPCFAEDTLILMGDRREKRIQHLAVGDSVSTADKGPRPVVWIGKRCLSKFMLHNEPDLSPIRIGKGSLAPNVPHSDLLVSPQHRILVRSKISERMTGNREVLVPAKHLLNISGVDKAAPGNGVTYFHILLADHSILIANGVEAESLHLGGEVGKIFTHRQICEIREKLSHTTHALARETIKRKQAERLVFRHQKNSVPFLPDAGSMAFHRSA